MKSCKGCHYLESPICTQGNYTTMLNNDYLGATEVIMNKYTEKKKYLTVDEMRGDELKCGRSARFYITSWQYFKQTLKEIFNAII